MNILVYGIGVIGSVYAVRLAKAGFSVTVLARGDRLKSIQDKGLRIRNAFIDHEEEAKVRVIEKMPKNGAYDFILVVVRSGQIESVLSTISKSGYSGPVAVIGNNLEDLKTQEKLVGRKNFVLGFGSFGGYRDEGTIVYTDGRTIKKPNKQIKTVLGVRHPEAEGALEIVKKILITSSSDCVICGDIQSWLVFHAALVFPLAGSMFGCGGDQHRTCRTRDAIVLGIRACKELFKALKSLGYTIEPKKMKFLFFAPEWILYQQLKNVLSSEVARIAMFGHANAPGGRHEIKTQALKLNGIIEKSSIHLTSWKKLLPYFEEKPMEPLISDGAKTIPLRFW